MRRTIAAATILLAAAAMTGADAQEPSSITLAQLTERMAQSEAALADRLKTIKPIIEVYAQHVEAHASLGTVPVRDEYFLGQFEWLDKAAPSLRRLTPEKAASQKVAEWLSGRSQLKPEAFAAMTMPDWRALDAAHYQISLARREFLGEVRCLVLDVASKDTRAGFTGRLWVEERNFTIVRFNGVMRGLPGLSRNDWFNVDSWRVHVTDDVWVPAYVYAEQQWRDTLKPRIKSQVRLWGYDLKNPTRAQEFTTIRIGGAIDAADTPQQLSPTESYRLWEKQAEENIVDRLTKAGLLAPPGDVAKILETVVKNLQITNDLPLEPPIEARVLLTSSLDSFTVGRTIVFSRGLIDVLPDEASLAMMLAHELAHHALGHRVIDPQFAFADKLMVPDDELLTTVRLTHDLPAEQAADAKVVELLRKSPYQDKLDESLLFLQVLDDSASRLKSLIQPHVGLRIARDSLLRRMSDAMPKAPEAKPADVDQIGALPLGGRITMNPWTSEVELLRGAALPATAREKRSLAVTPLIPYLRYVEPGTTAKSQR